MLSCWQCKYYTGSFSEIVEFMGEIHERFWGECKLHNKKVYEDEEACENFKHRYSKEIKNKKEEGGAMEKRIQKQQELFTEKSSEKSIPQKDGFLQVIEEAKRRAEVIEKLKQIVLQVTRKEDWIDYGEPYLTASGAKRIARIFGVSWKIEEPSIEEFEDGHFQYTCFGKFSFAGVEITETGVASSRDKMLSGMPPEEVDRAFVKKKAYTNCINRGLKSLLGLSFTWDDLAQSGIKRSEVKKVFFRKEKESEKSEKEKPAETEKKAQGGKQ